MDAGGHGGSHAYLTEEFITALLGRLAPHDTNLDKTSLFRTALISATSSTVADLDLRRLIDAWPTLSEPVKAGILAMVEAITTEEPYLKGL